MGSMDKGKKPGCMFGPVGGLGKRYAVINEDNFYTIENLFQGIQDLAGVMTQEDHQVGQIAYTEAVARGKELLYDPEMVRKIAETTQVKSKRVTIQTVGEIVRDMQSGAIVEEVEYDDIETKVTEEGVEDVIYVGGKTQSIYTPKKNKEKAWRVFWDLARSIKEEEDEGVDFTKGTMDQEGIMFGTKMDQDQDREEGPSGEGDWTADQPTEEPPAGNRQGWGGHTLGDRGWKDRVGQRGRREERERTTPRRRVTSEGSPTPRKNATGTRMEPERVVVLGTTLNPIQTVERGGGEAGQMDRVDTVHPWELEDTEMEGLETALKASKPIAAQLRRMNESKHAPAEVNPAQIDLSKKQAAEIAAQIDEIEKAKAENAEMEGREPEGERTVESEKGPTRWDKILGKG